MPSLRGGGRGRARAGAAHRRGRATPLPALRRDLARRDVPRPASVRAARARAAPAVAGGRRARERVVGGLLGRIGAVFARCPARAARRAGPRIAARQRSLLEENLAIAQVGAFDGVSDAVRARVRFEQRDLAADGPPPGRWRLVLCRNVAIYMTAGGPRAALQHAGRRHGAPRRAPARPQRAAHRSGRATGCARSPRTPTNGWPRDAGGRSSARSRCSGSSSPSSAC